MVELTVRESSPIRVQLDEDEFEALIALGRTLSSSKRWWGAADEESRGNVIGISRRDTTTSEVVFREVVGTVSVGRYVFRVTPKIPASHFGYIVRSSSLAPRMSRARASGNDEDGFGELLAHWFLDSAETLLRAGLLRGYAESTEEGDSVRGRIEVLETSLSMFGGRAAATCTFEELSQDTPFNRLIRAAARILINVSSPVLSGRAARVARHLEGVSSATQADMRAQVDRLTVRYQQVLPLAKLIIDGGGISLQAGSVRGFAFLLRTPELIEDGLREHLASALPEIRVAKRRLQLGGSGLSISPDLVFNETLAVGDVKYRLIGSDWDRSALYQAVTFATGFATSKAAVVGFGDLRKPVPRSVHVGNVEVQSFLWDTNQPSPVECLSQLANALRRWLLPQ